MFGPDRLANESAAFDKLQQVGTGSDNDDTCILGKRSWQVFYVALAEYADSATYWHHHETSSSCDVEDDIPDSTATQVSEHQSCAGIVQPVDLGAPVSGCDVG